MHVRAVPRRPDRARGSAIVTSVLVGALLAAALALVSMTARATVARARAQSAADAVALAAAVEPALASRVAAADGATVVSIVDHGGEVEVVVVRHGVRAVARAAVLECRGSCPAIP